MAVRPGGSILVAAPCPDAMGSAEFFRLLSGDEAQPDDFLRRIARREGKVTYNVLGYYLARIRTEKEVLGFVPGVPDRELSAIGLRPVPTLQAGVDALLARHGQAAKIAILPVGSETIPRIII